MASKPFHICSGLNLWPCEDTAFLPPSLTDMCCSPYLAREGWEEGGTLFRVRDAIYLKLHQRGRALIMLMEGVVVLKTVPYLLRT